MLTTELSEQASAPLLPMDVLENAADCLRVMAHPTRLRMIDALVGTELPVHELARTAACRPHQACEHLRLMKGHGLLASRRSGRTVLYRIANPSCLGVIECIRRSCKPE